MKNLPIMKKQKNEKNGRTMTEEYQSIMKNDVWDIVPRPEGKSIVLAIKTDLGQLTERQPTHSTYCSLVYVWDNYLSQGQGPAACKMCSQTRESL